MFPALLSQSCTQTAAVHDEGEADVAVGGEASKIGTRLTFPHCPLRLMD